MPELFSHQSGCGIVPGMNATSLTAFSAELRDISDLEKRAIDPLTIAASGVLSHIGGNVATKLLHPRLAGHRASTMASGVRDALTGTPRAASSMLKERWLGPEHVQSEVVGRLLGGQLRELPVGRQYRTLKKIRKAVAMTPELKHTPVFEDTVSAVNRMLASPLPKAGPVQAQSLMSKAAPYLGVPVALATEPGALVHLGVNRLRSAIAASPMGRGFMRRTGLEGVSSTPIGERAIQAGRLAPHSIGGLAQGMALSPEGKLVGRLLEQGPAKPMSKLKELATDVFISPAALDARRMGESLGSLASQPGGLKKIQRLQGAFEPVTRLGRTVHQAGQSGAAGSSFAALQDAMSNLAR